MNHVDRRAFLGMSVGALSVLPATAIAQTVCVTGGLALGMGEPLTCIATSLAIGVFLFGLLTVVSVHRLFRLAVTDYALPLAFLVTLVTTALAALIKVYVVEDDTSFGSVGLIAAFEAVLLTSSIAILNRCGVTWPRELSAQLRGRAAGDGIR